MSYSEDTARLLQQKVWALEKRCSRLNHLIREKDGVIRHLQSNLAETLAIGISRILQEMANKNENNDGTPVSDSAVLSSRDRRGDARR
jgi:hypothetical protein